MIRRRIDKALLQLFIRNLNEDLVNLMTYLANFFFKTRIPTFTKKGQIKDSLMFYVSAKDFLLGSPNTNSFNIKIIKSIVHLMIIGLVLVKKKKISARCKSL